MGRPLVKQAHGVADIQGPVKAEALQVFIALAHHLNVGWAAVRGEDGGQDGVLLDGVVFPAGLLGAAYVKAVKAPLKHIPVTAVGNVTVENCAEFIRAGAVGVGVGGSLVSATLVDEGKFDEITATARAYVAALRG